MRPYFERGGVTLWLGDTLEVMRTLSPLGADAIVTDPPYSSGTRREAAKGLRKAMNRTDEDEDWFTTDCLTTDGFTWLMRASALEWKRHSRPGAHILSFIDWRMALPLAVALESADLRRLGILVWDKTYFGMGSYFRNQYEMLLHFTNGKSLPAFRRDVGNVLRCPPVKDGDHPTEKPVPLLKTIISVVCPPGGLIFDPFAGSGPALEAAAHLGCRAVGIEIEEKYCEIAARRLDQMPLFVPSDAEPQPTQAALIER